MKKVLLVGATLSLLSTSAMASQARLLALGMNETDNDGMYHIQDRRNIFLNPAWLNVYNNYVTAEFGDKGYSPIATSSATLDNDLAPKGQGGFFKKHGSMVYGLYLGAESNTSTLLRLAGTAQEALGVGQTLHSADNQFDLFLAGDQGLKWGANVTFARGKDDARQASDLAIATRWGVMGDKWDAHLNLSLASKAHATESNTVWHELKGKLGAQLGGSYVISGNNRVFGYVKHYAWEQAKKVGATKSEWKGDFTSYHLGWGTHYDVNTSDKLFVSFTGKKTDINAKFANKGEIRHLVLPVSVAYEVKTSEWLTLRGSITQSIFSTRNNKNLTSINPVARGVIASQFGAQGKGTVANTTDVRAGATLTFGNLELDALVGAAKNGQLDGNDLFSRAALTYSF